MAENVLFREELDNKYFRNIETIVKDLKSYAFSNFEYYKGFDDSLSMRFVKSLSFLLEYISDGLLPGLNYVLSVGRSHDYSENHPGNGYRSLVKLVEKCCLRILTLIRYISLKKSSVFFRHETHGKELEAFVNVLGQLKAILHYAHEYSKSLTGQLIVDECDENVYNIMLEIESLSQELFFGTCLGFQFCESMQKPLNVMHLLLACYSEGFNKSTAFMKVAASLLHSGKFYLSPELRSKKVVSATIDGDISFCKSFWSLSENNLLHNLAKFVSPNVSLEITFNIPTDPVQVPLTSDASKSIQVLPSSSHGEPLPLPVRLISFTQRKGQLKAYSQHPPSDCLIIHCHGGGFVAQSSLSHASYLRHWAKDLDVPIVSIDYSLAPEYAYPRQVEEIFFAYCWILNNLEVLGSTGKTIVMVGDSAGANLVLSTALRTIDKGVRKPDGILCVYGCFLVRYSPTPSRLLSLMDPVLPLGNLTNCLTAYIGFDVRLKEDIYKKRRLQKQQSKQILQTKRRSERQMKLKKGENSNNNLSDDVEDNADTEDLNNKNETFKSKARRSFKRLFNDNTFDFMRKQNHTSIKKPSKSCEFEDVSLNSSKKLYAFRTQKSHDSPKESKEKKSIDIRLSQSEKHLTSVNDDANDNSNNIDQGGEDDLVNKENKKSNSIIKMRDGVEEVNNNSQKEESESAIDSIDVTESTSFVGTNNKTKVTPTPSCASVSSNGGDDDRVLEEGEDEVKKLEGCTYPDSAILGHRKVLLDMKALRRQLEHTHDHFLSPVFAPDSALKQLNCISFVGLHLDPLLDESVHMAKRMKALGAQVSLDLVDDLPHGFLNFMHLSKEAYQASILCGLRLKRLLIAGNRIRLASDISLSNISCGSTDVIVNKYPSDVAVSASPVEAAADATTVPDVESPNIAVTSSNESVPLATHF